ncbi:UDP-glucosyltransferase B1 [Colletotrichum spaethianum]|uniref:UDP-glucosyltransferase B1 n=1 Tax=Colletotrichum spaethianum TaxID=700344 RepID=A0AA37UL22_9PEZI|nr:UDP-glucosyltransferase B1 [Colletotrichum spaethianum]GKT51001.1 UDP-glucosyltransferase B1 [Colletotrichum spaethianum]
MTANTTNKPKVHAESKPLILVASFPAEGHIIPLLAITSYLFKKGYEVVFIAPSNFHGKVEEAGAEYIESENPFTDITLQALGDLASLPVGPERFAGQVKTVFLDTLHLRTQKTEEVLALLKARDPGRQIIFIEDVLNWSFLPFKHGRPLPQGFTEIPKTIGIGVAAFMLESRDTGPVSLGLPPDSTPSGRQRNEILQDLVEKGPMKPMIDSWQEAMRRTGCTRIPNKRLFRHCYTAHDFTLQLCSPSLEYPISDLPPTVEFIGVMPRKAPSPDYEYPTWWSEVERAQENNKYRHVVFVSQGTVNADYSELVLPSIEAFSNRQDVLVVVTLGVRGAQLPSEFTIPPNVRVLDYLPYDTILEYTDVFVSNAGYGAFTHSVRNGVPIVLAGENEEKIEVTMRGVYAGLGVSLATQRPTPEQVRKGVEQILRDIKYKKAAINLKRETDSMDALAAVEKKVEELTI